jgi:hypothetical protein
MKRGLLGFPLLILLTQVISAQFYSGYGSFSLTNFFDRIDPQTIILVLLFLIFFALIFYALSRIFKDPYGQPNKGIAGTIAFAVTSLIIYGLYRTGFDLGSIFYNWGFSVGSLYPILAVVFLIVAFLLIWKLGFGRFLMTFGLFIILLTAFTEIFYEKGLVLIIGIVLLGIGLLLGRRSRRVMGGVGRGALRAGKWVGSKYDWEKEKRQAKAIGRGVAAPFKAVRKYRDPGHRLLKYHEKREAAEQKRATKRALAHEKAAYKEDKRMHPGAIRRAGRGVGKGVGKGIGRKFLRAEQQAAYKEEAKRQRAEQAQEQIQQINNEVARLEQMIPNASVIERGKIEDQIRALLKRAKKLR